jgi:hypothetical protein
MCWNYLDYDAMIRSKVKAKNFKKQPYILVAEKAKPSKKREIPDMIKPISEPQIISSDPSWEVAFKGQDEDVKVSYIVFDPKLTDSKPVSNGPVLGPFIAKTKPKSKPKNPKPPVKSNGKGPGPVRKGKEKKP